MVGRGEPLTSGEFQPVEYDEAPRVGLEPTTVRLTPILSRRVRIPIKSRMSLWQFCGSRNDCVRFRPWEEAIDHRPNSAIITAVSAYG